MTKDAFLVDFYFKSYVEELSNGKISVTTQVIKRTDQKLVGNVGILLDINFTQDFIADSHSLNSLIQWNWTNLIEQVKRAQLDHFVNVIPIDNYFPLNMEVDTSDMYE